MIRKPLSAILIVIVISGIILAGCERSVTKQAVVIPTTTLSIPFPVATEQNTMKDIISGTQTAIAQAQLILEATATSEVALPTVYNAMPTPTPEYTPTAPIATPVITRPATWALQKGEHPYCIARRFDVNVHDLLYANGLSIYSNSLPVGTVLNIPANSTWNIANGARALRSHPATYTVKSGDTIYGVACYFGDVHPDALIAVNQLQSPYTLTPGQQLSIP